jgi:futalosine hydrolase
MLALVFATSRESRACLGPAHAGIREGQWAAITVHDRPCLQVITGIGPVNAALVFGKVLATFPRLQGAINLGIGGSFDLDRADLGEWAAATRETWPEIGVRHKAGVHARTLGFPQGHAGQDTIWESIDLDPDAHARAMNVSLPPSMARLPFITVAGVTATHKRALFLQTMYNGGIENMEGFSLALACATHSLPFLEIRTVSNKAGPRDTKTWQFGKALGQLGRVLPALFATPVPHTTP